MANIEDLTFLDSVKHFVMKELNDDALGLDQVKKLRKIYGKDDRRVKVARLDVFFRAYALVGTPAFAAQIAGLNRHSVEKLINSNARMKERFDQAHDEFCQFLEQAAIMRAFRKSDTLLMFELRANNPRKFSERFRIQTLGMGDDKPFNVVFGDGTASPNYATKKDEQDENIS